MSRITDLQQLICSLDPLLGKDEFVFLCLPHDDHSPDAKLNPIATIVESEGRTLIVSKAAADSSGHDYSEVFRRITLRVFSSLQAVGLTAAISTALAKQGIPANVLAGFHHDHVFVPAANAELAIQTLNDLSHQD